MKNCVICDAIILIIFIKNDLFQTLMMLIYPGKAKNDVYSKFSQKNISFFPVSWPPGPTSSKNTYDISEPFLSIIHGFRLSVFQLHAVAPSVEREQSIDKKFAACKIELSSHLIVTLKLMAWVWGLSLWEKKIVAWISEDLSCMRNSIKK